VLWVPETARISDGVLLSRLKALRARAKGKYLGFSVTVCNSEMLMSGSTFNLHTFKVASADPETNTLEPGATAMQLIELS